MALVGYSGQGKRISAPSANWSPSVAREDSECWLVECLPYARNAAMKSLAFHFGSAPKIGEISK